MFKNILEGSMAPTPQQCAPLLHILEDLVYKEQSILFPMASQVLFDADWDTVARGEEEIGYCFIDHIDRVCTDVICITLQQWKPMTAADVHTVVSEYSAPSNKIPLSTGALTAEQIDGIFKVLPMDISFVDIDERVAYYSGMLLELLKNYCKPQPIAYSRDHLMLLDVRCSTVIHRSHWRRSRIFSMHSSLEHVTALNFIYKWAINLF